MDVTPVGMVMAVSALAPLNAFTPMDVSLLPVAKVTVARLVAPENVSAPMDVTPAGMVMAVSALAPENAALPMDVTPVGTVAMPVQPICALTALFVIVNVPPPEHATVVVAACATVPFNPNNIMLIRMSVNIR